MKINYNKILFAFFVILITILLFTAIDYYIHSLDTEYSVPGYYYKNKIIYGTIIASITYFFVRKKVFWQKSLIVSAVTAVLLQTNYYLQGYPREFVLEYLVFHFLMLLPVSFVLFWFFRRRI